MRRFAPFLATLAVLVGAQTSGKFALTVDNIMRGPGLVGYAPSQVRWSGDSTEIYFQWKQPAQSEESPLDTYVVHRDGSGLRKLSVEEANSAPPVSGDLSHDRRRIVYAREGDLFVYDNATGKTRRVTRTADAELNPRFLRDGRRIAFTRANNLYVLSLDDGTLDQLTDVRSESAPGLPTSGGGRGGRGGAGAPAAAGVPARGTPSQEFLKKQETELLEVVRDRAALRQAQEDRRKQENPRKPFTLQARQNVASLQLSPDGKFVIASISETAANAKNTIVPNFVNESAYVEDIPGRTNVGDSQPRTRLALIDVASGEVKWVDSGQKREVRLYPPEWSEDGTKAVLLARSADNKDRWILALDPATGNTRILATDHDDAWVGGPGANTLGWMKNDQEIYFQSERTGYSQLYAVPFSGGEPRALTSGKWEVTDVKQTADKSKFILVASKDTPYEHQVYEMEGNGGPLTRLSAAPGLHGAVLSPDDHWFADVHSYTNRPPELYVQELRTGVESRKLTSSPAPEFWQYPWQDAPIVTFTARDGVQVPARLFKPAHARPNGPGVVFVHGAGYLQNVDREWSEHYYHEYLFHHLLIERGFTVIDVDYRGSAGYGRDWRTAIYEHMGGKDLDDIVDAAKYLASEQHVNPKKIGIYGGSYGGFMTLMAMFTQPDVFAAGAALRPVTDWAHYNHGYTSDILNLPQTDSDAYRRSSPIYFAQGLKGALLICHGMADTNVEFQDSVRLVQRLIELRKENWQLAVYPVENHGFVEPSSWADEYKRILALFETNLK